jgi:hypothetical protein
VAYSLLDDLGAKLGWQPRVADPEELGAIGGWGPAPAGVARSRE